MPASGYRGSMAINMSGNQREALLEGATDGSYRKVRPDTKALPVNTANMMDSRQHLDPWYNYGYVTQEIPLSQRSIPGA